MKRSTTYLVLLLAVGLLLPACVAKKQMDARATERIISIKAKTAFLMDKHDEDYAAHAADVDELMLLCLEAYEYEKVRKKSHTAIKIWEVMMDEEKQLLGGFLKRWEENSLTDAFISNSKFGVMEGLNILAHLMYRRVDADEVNRARNFLDKYTE